VDFVLLAVIGISVFGLSINRGGQSAYLSKSQTSAVNGIFVMFVFLRHFRSYIEIGRQDSFFAIVDGYLGQLIVTTFLFYSGYGIMLSLKEKENYGKRLPMRFLTVWMQFALAVCLYLILNLVLGIYYPVERILISFTAWESIGNSNWYIFAILCLYVFTYIGWEIARNKADAMIAIVTVCCVLYVVVVYLFGKGSWFYDTIFCYPVGMLYASHREQINRFVFKTENRRVIIAIASFFLFAIFYIARMYWSGLPRIFALEARSVWFALTIVAFTTMVKIGNPILDWLGKYTFEIFILQRLPMIVLQNMENKYVYFLLCVVVTVAGAVLFKAVWCRYAQKKGTRS
jgi:hypothetical protein